MIRIDGSFGEGGGQVLRTSLSLSLVTGQPFCIENIRAGRERPGLLRQHLTAVLAAAEVGSAQVEGATLGSRLLTFRPGQVRGGDYHFAIGTAGSSTLVFQTLLPALMLAPGPSTLSLEGGTHNDGAPPYHFLERVFLPLIERLGPRVTSRLERFGFYPAGGGRFVAQIEPAQALRPLSIGPRGVITSRRIHAIVANLHRHIAQREADTALTLLNWEADSRAIEVTEDSAGPGNVIMIEISTRESTEIFTGFGKRGVSAETVAQRAASEAQEYLASSAAVGEHLTDQLLLPMALAGVGSLTALKLNQHARTNMDVIAKFLSVRFACRPCDRHTQVEVSRCSPAEIRAGLHAAHRFE